MTKKSTFNQDLNCFISMSAGDVCREDKRDSIVGRSRR